LAASCATAVAGPWVDYELLDHMTGLWWSQQLNLPAKMLPKHEKEKKQNICSHVLISAGISLLMSAQSMAYLLWRLRGRVNNKLKKKLTDLRTQDCGARFFLLANRVNSDQKKKLTDLRTSSRDTIFCTGK
jgi:hypothetical protein